MGAIVTPLVRALKNAIVNPFPNANTLVRNLLPAGSENFVSNWSAYGGAVVGVSGINNLLPADSSGWEQGSISGADGTPTVITDRIRTINPIVVTAGVPYINSLVDASYSVVGVFWYKADNTFLSANTTPVGSVTAPPLATKAKVVLRKADTVVIQPSEISTIKPQFELGTVATPAVLGQTPYRGPSGQQVYRIVTRGGSNLFKYWLSTGIGASTTGLPYCQQVQVKNLAATSVLTINNISATTVTNTQADGWKLNKIEGLVGNTANLNPWIKAANIADTLDFLACEPMVDKNPVAYPYTPPQTSYWY